MGWIALFAAKCLDVRISSTRPDAREYVTEALRLYAASLPGGAVPVDQLTARLTFFTDVESAVAGADVVQENVLENLQLKRAIFARVATSAPAHALLLSSTSTLLPHDLGADLDDPARVMVGHPFNPVHIVPLVEIVASDGANPAAIDSATGFYRSMGKVPIVLRRPVPGFVANRLQAALLRESIHLIREGVVTVGELDEIVTASVGSRWAVVGPFRAFHLGGGPGGLRWWLEHVGDGLERSWAALGSPQVDEATKARILEQADAAFGAASYEELAAERDTEQNAVLSAVAAVRRGTSAPSPAPSPAHAQPIT
jgi:ketoreductase RED1